MQAQLKHALRTLTRASPAYWILQVLTMLLAIVTALFLVQSVDGQPLRSANGSALRMILGALFFFLITHVGIRAVLHGFFGLRGWRFRTWLVFALWLVVVTFSSFGLNQVANNLVPATGNAEITNLKIPTENGSTKINFEGGALSVFVFANLYASYAFWAGLYLAWQAFLWRRRLQQQANQARLTQLTHQLNPHFLFNALNTIRGTIFESQKNAADLITELSELFRFHLNMSDQSTQTLANDWRIAQRYLALEQARLENRLRVKASLAPDCLGRSVPALSVLGLLENAIKHGVAPNPDGGDIEIFAHTHAKYWVLSVSNALGEQKSTQGTQVGLQNLRERLALGFGAEAVLKITHDKTRFSVSIEFPLESK